MRKLKTTILTTICILSILPQALQALGGIRLPQASPDNGVAFAGEAAVARDAATAIKNPAGMSFLDTSEVLFGMQPGCYWAFWDIDEETTFNGNKGGNGGAAFFGMTGYMVYKFDNKLSAGFSMFSPGAVDYNYGRDFKGRYFTQRGLFPTVSWNWSLAYKITPCFSFGAGLTIGYGYYNAAAALPENFDFGALPNANRLKFNLDNWKRVDLGKLAYGYDVGLMYQLTPRTRLGVIYHSQLNFRLHGTVEAITTTSGAVYSSVDTTFRIPQYVLFSIYHKYSSCVTLLANVGWDNWSIVDTGTFKFKEDPDFPVQFPDNKLSVDYNWHDTMHFALGAEYKQTDRLTLQGGVSYDSSPVTSSDRELTLPYSNWLYFGTGFIYKMTRCENFGCNLLYARSIPHGRKVDLLYAGIPELRFKGKVKVDLTLITFFYNRKFG